MRHIDSIAHMRALPFLSPALNQKERERERARMKHTHTVVARRRCFAIIARPVIKKKANYFNSPACM